MRRRDMDKPDREFEVMIGKQLVVVKARNHSSARFRAAITLSKGDSRHAMGMLWYGRVKSCRLKK